MAGHTVPKPLRPTDIAKVKAKHRPLLAHSRHPVRRLGSVQPQDIAHARQRVEHLYQTATVRFELLK